MGTANYLAPERCGAAPVDDFAGDWYGFGVTLHEVLTGELPQRGRSASVRQWPMRLTALIEGLLAHSPGARPRGPLVVHELVALEIAALGSRRAA